MLSDHSIPSVSVTVDVLVISGSMGAGKTTVLNEASDLLRQANIAHAAIDLDTLGVVYAAGTDEDDLAFRNLSCVWANYRQARIERLLIAGAVDRRELARIMAIDPAARIQVCRLTASRSTMRSRVEARELGIFQETYVTRVDALDGILDDAAVEDFSVESERNVTDVAREVLERARWM
jgi:molybdopterin-guanine dinucleotide biosynthesis protein